MNSVDTISDCLIRKKCELGLFSLVSLIISKQDSKPLLNQVKG